MAIGHSVVQVKTAEEAIKMLTREDFDLVCLDHDLGGRTFVDSNDSEGTGYTVAKAIVENKRRPRQVVVHSFNPVGSERIERKLRAAGIAVIRAPFGTWSLNG